ncbi:MAG: hypothetical protein ACI3ZD_03540 [Prevotella sp.]
MKTIREALLDEIIYPISEGKVDNKMIARGLNGDDEYDFDVANSNAYMGCFADCLVALLQSVSFSEADKSVSALSDEAKKKLLNIANSIYKTIGEEEVVIDPKPTVYINC